MPMDLPERGEDGPRRIPLPGAFGGTILGPRRTEVLVPGIGDVLFAVSGVFGANLSVVGPELSRTLKIAKGMLVNDVLEGTSASKAGLRPGDVITSIDGQLVTSLAELHALVA